MTAAVLERLIDSLLTHNLKSWSERKYSYGHMPLV